jgi:hypothetical protein
MSGAKPTLYVPNCMSMIELPAMRIKLIMALLLLIGANIAYSQDEVSDLLSRINNLRASVGRAPYSLNGSLSAAAGNQAQWIVETGNVSHTRPDGSGPRSRALNAGYPSTQVSENIYGGTNAGVDSAWTFWVNSGIHYAGLVNAAYNDVGIGVARGGWGAAYVLVFGNSGGPPPPAPQALGASNDGGNAAVPPAYVLGLDEHGNIMHEVQPGDTLGDIALIYGYTWDDLPAMMALNGISDVRDLEVGSVFLVPSKSGTYTPTPSEATPAPAPTDVSPTEEAEVALIPVNAATLVVTPLALLTQTATPNAPATVGNSSLPSLFAADATATLAPVVTQVAMVATNPPQPNTVAAASTPSPRSSSSLWIGIAVVVQLFVVAIAAVEFIRRARRRGRR